MGFTFKNETIIVKFYCYLRTVSDSSLYGKSSALEAYKTRRQTSGTVLFILSRLKANSIFVKSKAHLWSFTERNYENLDSVHL